MDTMVETDACPLPVDPGTARDVDGLGFRLRDGRRISYGVFGARDGYPVLSLHGTPGSRLKFRSAAAIAASLGLKLICPDRWGYGDTSPHPCPNLSAFAWDGLALLDGLGVGRFGLIGVSGGCPYATAVAAVAGDRVSRLALVSPVGPIDGLRGSEMRAFHRLWFRMLPRIPGATTALFRFYRRLLLLAPRSAIGVASRWSIDVDREIIRTPSIRDDLAASFRAGLSRHAVGAVCDVKLFAAAWNFDVGQVRAPARIWLGTLDCNVPQPAVLALAEAIPLVELTRVVGEGHFLITCHHEEVLRWVMGGHILEDAGDRQAASHAYRVTA